ncbi:11387_t:CDS:1 [Dentiscutata erythropus]|uniref:11387_t:CDS:1 n=1 Tax=Dentiscutata erythropus TaxID=1348616 RepID=A0A9N9I7C0_9GLOM|nr:11387_t:CDS:1 [Dentiscutata erythropus]
MSEIFHNRFNLCGVCEIERAYLARESNPLNLNLLNVPQNNQEARNDFSRLENKIDRLQEQVTQLIELQKEDQKRIKSLENELEIERKHSKDVDSWYRKILDNMISNEKERNN